MTATVLSMQGVPIEKDVLQTTECVEFLTLKAQSAPQASFNDEGPSPVPNCNADFSIPFVLRASDATLPDHLVVVSTVLQASGKQLAG